MANEEEYYVKRLSASRLKKCYDIATPRIKQYLESEIKFVLEYIKSTDIVLELGSGYGRVIAPLSKKAHLVYGIDTSVESLELARVFLTNLTNVKLLEMNVKSLTFNDQMFDIVIAIQNGISAFKVDPTRLIMESIRVTKNGGKVMLSSYSEKLWDDRLKWFIRQAAEGLLGEVDLEKSGNGTIICKDGFKATTYTIDDFSRLIKKLDLNAIIKEVDQSSIFCVIDVNH